MKNTLTIIVTAFLLLSMVACGKANNKNSTYESEGDNKDSTYESGGDNKDSTYESEGNEKPVTTHEHTYGEWEYDEVSHQRSLIECTLNKCELTSETAKHFDDNRDHLCDECGYEYIKSEHVGEWQITASTHQYKYSCGCLPLDIAKEHVDKDNNYNCDICNCFMTTHPDSNNLLRNISGYEWLNEVALEDIEKVKIIISPGSVAPGPGTYYEISTSISVEAMARIFEEYYWIEPTPDLEHIYPIPGDRSKYTEFHLKDGTVKELPGYYFTDEDSHGYVIKDAPSFKEEERYTTSYCYGGGSSKVYDNSNNFICSIPLGGLEFERVKSIDASELNKKAVTHVIKGNYIALHFVSDKYFFVTDARYSELYEEYYRGHGYCKLVETSLDDLLSKHTP